MTLRKGPYGHYVQLGEGAKGEKPKRASLPKALSPADVDLDKAVRLLALPRELGRHPKPGRRSPPAIGRFGPYLKHGSAYASLGRDDDVLTIGLNRAVTLLAEAKSKRPAAVPDRARRPPEGRQAGDVCTAALWALCEAWPHHRFRAARPHSGRNDAGDRGRAPGAKAGKAKGGPPRLRAKAKGSSSGAGRRRADGRMHRARRRRAGSGA